METGHNQFRSKPRSVVVACGLSKYSLEPLQDNPSQREGESKKLSVAPPFPQEPSDKRSTLQLENQLEGGSDIWDFFGGGESEGESEGESGSQMAEEVVPGAVAVRGDHYNPNIESAQLQDVEDQTQASVAQAIRIDAELAEAQAQRERQRILDEAVRAGQRISTNTCVGNLGVLMCSRVSRVSRVACPPRFYANPTAPYIRTQKIRTIIL
jgi:hypothetical protein